MFPGAEVKCAVLLTSIKEILTKKGDRMAFATIEDLTGHGEVTFFPRTYAAVRELLQGAEQPLYLEARLDKAEGRDMDDEGEENTREIKLLGSLVRPLAEVCQNSDAPVPITIPLSHCTPPRLKELRAILEGHKGNNEVDLHLPIDDHLCILKAGSRLMVCSGPELDHALAQWSALS